MTVPPEALVDNYYQAAETARALVDPEAALYTSFDDGVTVIDIDLIDEIIPADEPGSFVMRFKQEIVENKGKAVVITGAALIATAACIGLIARRSRKNHRPR